MYCFEFIERWLVNKCYNTLCVSPHSDPTWWDDEEAIAQESHNFTGISIADRNIDHLTTLVANKIFSSWFGWLFEWCFRSAAAKAIRAKNIQRQGIFPYLREIQSIATQTFKQAKNQGGYALYQFPSKMEKTQLTVIQMAETHGLKIEDFDYLAKTLSLSEVNLSQIFGSSTKKLDEEEIFDEHAFTDDIDFKQLDEKIYNLENAAFKEFWENASLQARKLITTKNNTTHKYCLPKTINRFNTLIKRSFAEGYAIDIRDADCLFSTLSLSIENIIDRELTPSTFRDKIFYMTKENFIQFWNSATPTLQQFITRLLPNIGSDINEWENVQRREIVRIDIQNNPLPQTIKERCIQSLHQSSQQTSDNPKNCCKGKDIYVVETFDHEILADTLRVIVDDEAPDEQVYQIIQDPKQDLQDKDHLADSAIASESDEDSFSLPEEKQPTLCYFQPEGFFKKAMRYSDLPDFQNRTNHENIKLLNASDWYHRLSTLSSGNEQLFLLLQALDTQMAWNIPIQSLRHKYLNSSHPAFATQSYLVSVNEPTLEKRKSTWQQIDHSTIQVTYHIPSCLKTSRDNDEPIIEPLSPIQITFVITYNFNTRDWEISKIEQSM